MSSVLNLPPLKRHTMVVVTSNSPKELVSIDRGKLKSKTDIAREGLYIFGGADDENISQGKLIYVDTSK